MPSEDKYGTFKVLPQGGPEPIAIYVPMTLRAWLAGQALAGYMASLREAVGDHVARVGAEESYRIADAMLMARKDNSDGRK